MSENITNNEDFNDENQQIDKLQELIKQKMVEDEASATFDDFSSNEDYSSVSSSASVVSSNNSGKKYVISILPENVEFFDKLSPEKRVQIVNTVISAYNEDKKLPDDVLRTKKLLKHLVVVFITIAIGFPLVFYLVNASIEATANSYREIQNNFEKLYQQKGGIKRKDMSKLQNLKY